MERLGVARLPGQDDTPVLRLDAKATLSIRRLHAEVPASGPQKEDSLLFARLLRALEPGERSPGNAVPVLVRPALAPGARDPAKPVSVLSRRVAELRWLSADQASEAWLASTDSRSLMAYFDEFAFVATFGGEKLAERLGVRAFAPREEAHPDEKTAPPQVDDAMRERLVVAMPYLLALVQTQRVSRHDHEQYVMNWECAVVQGAGNVYLELTVPGQPPKKIGYRNQADEPILNDVFVPNKTAWHDIRAPDQNAAEWLPKFAPWFADAVFGARDLTNRFRTLLLRVGEDWDNNGTSERALAELRQFDVAPDVVDDCREEFAAARLTPAQRQSIAVARRLALQPFGELHPNAVLLAPVLQPDVFATIRSAGATSETLTLALQGTELPHAVFDCVQIQRRRWLEAKGRLRQDVLARHLLLVGLDGVNDGKVSKLWEDWEAFTPAREALDRLGFDPAEAAQVRFPGRPHANETEWQNALSAAIRQPFGVLEATPVSLVRAGPVRPGFAPTKTAADRGQTDKKKREQGHNAENQRATEAARRVLGAPPTFHSRIDAQRHKFGLPRLDWATATLQSLKAGLWLADRDVDCGYDLLDVDLNQDAVLCVEMKSASGESGGQVGAFLTTTELARALEIGRHGAVQYRLEVDIGYSRRIDATAALFEALDDPWLRRALDGDIVMRPEHFELELRIGAS